MAALSLPSLLLRIQYRVTLVSAFTGLNLNKEKGKVKSEAEKSEQLWGKNSVPNKHLFFHSTRPVSRRGGRGGRGGQMLELFCKRPGEHFTASCEIIVKTQWFMQR